MRSLTKLNRARSRLRRSQILQENLRLKILAEIYMMHSIAQLQPLQIHVVPTHVEVIFFTDESLTPIGMHGFPVYKIGGFNHKLKFDWFRDIRQRNRTWRMFDA